MWNWTHLGIFFALSLLVCLCGFKKYVYFMSIGYGFSVAVIGAAMIVMSLIVSRVRRFKGLTILSMLVGIGALILPLAFGEWNYGAKNWGSLPVIGSFQPSEFVKLSLVLALAYSFSAHRTFWQMMPAIVFAAACLGLLMLQRDLGTALIYYMTTLTMFYVACGNVPLTMIGLAGGAGAAVMGYKMFAHVKVRVAMWRNPWSDPLDKGYQIIQALLAIGSGGLFGVGLGQGTPEKIPMYYNDFIFAVICEQLGIVFGVLLLGVYVLIVLRGVTIISRSRRSFDMLLGCGVLASAACMDKAVANALFEANGIPHGERYEECVAVHAEDNAISQAGRESIGATLYLAGIENGRLIDAVPCKMCARKIKNARIAEVVATTAVDD